MALKSFKKNSRFKEIVPITDEEFQTMIDEGFEESKLDSYSPLVGDICYSKSFYSKDDAFWVTCYITENGMAVDTDYTCGGNVNTWIRHYGDDDFEDVWNEMVDYSTNI